MIVFFFMNRSCLVCDSPATRVCQHKDCKLSPFFCSSPCAKNASEKLHIHNSEQNFISYEEFEKRMERTNKLLDPYNLHNEYLEEMRKKVDVTKEYLKEKIDYCLERFYQHIKKDICGEIQLQPTEKEKETVEKIKGHINNSPLSGKDLNELWKNQYTFKGQAQLKAEVECIKKAFDKQLKEIEELSIEHQDEFPSFNKILEASKKLCFEGWALLDDKQYKQALFKLKQARQINNFDYNTHCYIGQCLFNLNQLDEAKESYERVLSLYPYSSGVCTKIGQIYQKRKNFKEAIQWYSKAIQIQKSKGYFFSKRGECFLELKRFEQASADYFTASKLEPNHKQYKAKIQQIAKLTNKK